MGLVLSSVYSPSVNEGLPQLDLPSIPVNMFTLEKSSPFLFKAAHSLLAWNAA